ncbi:MAG: ribonuclease P protein component [Rhodospirillales bacterium]|nr:ribonuclease P protein component [Rhodospirillales bacterium]MSP80108.1 ribonuclease P protein component [Rhodospirillales bacterium]
MAGTLARLKRRPDFLKVAAARQKWVAPGLIVQVRRRTGAEREAGGRSGDKKVDPSLARVGFTVSGKVGNAVARNRARRRLRAALASLDAEGVAGGVDLVVIGRTETLVRPFPELVGDLVQAFKRLGVWKKNE